MKFGELKSVGHNIADSFASGVGMPTDIFEEALRSPDGFIVVDFLAAETVGSVASPDLDWALRQYAEIFRNLCERHGADVSDFMQLTARYGVDRIHGRHFTVTVEDRKGRSSLDRYVGLPGRKLRRGPEHP